MKKNIIAFILIGLAFSSCKKGENDPFFSLRTRKARIVRDWKIVDASIEENNSNTVGNSTSNNDSKFTIIGDNFTHTQTGNSEVNGTVIEAKWNIYKDYTWDRVITYKTEDTSSEITVYSTEKGIWSFVSKNSDTKNKERVSFDMISNEKRTVYLDKITSSTNEQTLSTDYNIGDYKEVFLLDRLSNKEMIMNFEDSYSNAFSNNGTISQTITKIFKANYKLKNHD